MMLIPHPLRFRTVLTPRLSTARDASIRPQTGRPRRRRRCREVDPACVDPLIQIKGFLTEACAEFATQADGRRVVAPRPGGWPAGVSPAAPKAMTTLETTSKDAKGY